MPGLILPKGRMNLGVRILAIGNRGSAGILHATTVMPQVTLPDFAHRMEFFGSQGQGESRSSDSVKRCFCCNSTQHFIRDCPTVNEVMVEDGQLSHVVSVRRTAAKQMTVLRPMSGNFAIIRG